MDRRDRESAIHNPQSTTESSGLRRAVAGARRGALVGVYALTLVLLFGLLRLAPDSQLLSEPVTGGIAIVAGFAGAVALLRLVRPYVRSAVAAVVVGSVCAYPALLGLIAGVGGWSRQSWTGAAVLAGIVGTIGGVMTWRGWYRGADS